MTVSKSLAASATGLAMAALLMATPASADWHGGRGGGHYGHHGWGIGGVAAGVIGGIALGALAVGASRPAYAVEPAYDGPVCYREIRPVHDAWGRYVGDRAVRVCD